MGCICTLLQGERDMQKKMKAIMAAVVVVVIIVITAVLVVKFKPGTEVMPLTEYYKTAADELTIILQNELLDEKGHYFEGMPYLSYDMVKTRFNDRFYWSEQDNILIYTTPTDVIKIIPDTTEYSINKEKVPLDYVAVKTFDDGIYLAAELVGQYSDIRYTACENPDRIMITNEWGVNVMHSSVKKEASLRISPDIKSPILDELAIGEDVVFVGAEEEPVNGFSKVITTDGIIGYVKNNRLNESEYMTLTSDFVAPEYTHITKDYDICMVWHQVFNQTANGNLLTLLNATKGVNTISPTWFSISDNGGGVSSLASERYVERAHQAGVEVWGLCNDFNKEIDLPKILASTDVREKLENKLLSLAIEYGLDGLNIDFENIPEESGEDFIQFIRELSIKCRTNGIVLSIDDYIPTEYRAYYDYNEQGNVADYVVIMAYDEHYAGSSEAGSVSSISFVKNAVNNIQKDVDASQVIMALPFYTRLWKTDASGKLTSEAYGMVNAVKHLKESNVTASWDEASAQYYVEYPEGGSTYKIWLEEERSIEEKIKAVTDGGISNVSFWKLGLENTETWNAIGKYINAVKAD